MSEVCKNCGKSVGDQGELQTWDAVCSHCGQLIWLKAGQTVMCKVTRVARFGIIVELGDGVEGLVSRGFAAFGGRTDSPSSGFPTRFRGGTRTSRTHTSAAAKSGA
jgi:DNA-directed RNA polymerase subunit RPC12/RpoP